MNLDSEFERNFKKWLKRHPDVWLGFGIKHEKEITTPHFWYVQNCLGDLFGWSEEYIKFIGKIIDKKYLEIDNEIVRKEVKMGKKKKGNKKKGKK